MLCVWQQQQRVVSFVRLRRIRAELRVLKSGVGACEDTRDRSAVRNIERCRRWVMSAAEGVCRLYGLVLSEANLVKMFRRYTVQRGRGIKKYAIWHGFYLIFF